MNHAEQVITLFKDHFGDWPITGIEIGTGEATITTAILSLPNVELLYTIDPYTHRPGEPFEAGGYSQEQHDHSMFVAMSKLKPYRGRFVLCPTTSDKALGWIKEQVKQVDFVWIDGHHARDQVQRDIEGYAPLVRQGGIVGGHDYSIDDVVAAVDAIYPEVRTGDDLTWWIIKE